MPTTRVRRRRNRVESLTEYQLAFLLDRELPEEAAGDTWWRIVEAHCGSPGSAHYARSAVMLWRANRDQLLATWLEDHPGYRPAIWWHSDAPRQPRQGLRHAWRDGEMEEPRQRIGGTGTPRFECMAHVPEYVCGIPTSWVTRPDLDIWPSLRGKAQAFDRHDPPLYEAQASYLARHGLLLPGERERLTEEDWAPEAAELENADE